WVRQEHAAQYHCRSRATLQRFTLPERTSRRAAIGHGGIYAAEGPAAALEKCPGQCHPWARAAGDSTAARACPCPGADGAVWAQGFRDGLSVHPLGWYAAAGCVPADDPT